MSQWVSWTGDPPNHLQRVIIEVYGGGYVVAEYNEAQSAYFCLDEPRWLDLSSVERWLAVDWPEGSYRDSISRSVRST